MTFGDAVKLSIPCRPYPLELIILGWAMEHGPPGI